MTMHVRVRAQGLLLRSPISSPPWSASETVTERRSHWGEPDDTIAR